jgi:thioesterase domain-containing protein
MASHYLREIRSLQPRSYYLGGMSFGGGCLRDGSTTRGARRVALLAMLDVNGWGLPNAVPIKVLNWVFGFWLQNQI